MESYSEEALPRLGMPEWLHLWSMRAPPPPKAPVRVLIVAFGLVRSLPMLETTLASLARFAPANATLSVRADVPKDLMEAAHACLSRRVALRTLNTILFEAHEAPPIHACNNSARRAIEHRNEREAAYLLKSVDDDEWVEADVAVLWRIDTQLISPIEAPALPVGRVLVPYLQNGGLLNDRYLVAHTETAQGLIDARVQLLENECVYGETALVRLLRALNVRVGFTRTRIVRMRADGFVPDIDKVASLGTIRPRLWMRPSAMSAQDRVFGVHGAVNQCPYFRAWESRCVWKDPAAAAPPTKPLPHPNVNATRGRVLFVGDSMDAQLFAATACHLWAHRERGMRLQLYFNAEWSDSVAALRKRCGKEMKQDCHYERAALRIAPDGADAARVPFASMELCQGDRHVCLDELGFDPFTDMVVTGADALHGVAHGVRGAFGRDGVPNATVVAAAAKRDLASLLRRVRPSELVWREATAQHFRAKGGHWTHGFMMRSNVEKLEARCAKIPMQELKEHAHWNQAIAPMLALHEVRVLKTWAGSARAWFNHVDHGDCTHFCQPSPLLDGWAATLLRILAVHNAH